ncbi:CoA ester lyase [Marinobacter sp. 71-i]|uniref:CoA ester lyase n=1 Tax=Marinobacter iranensis TaxID=2962607 RepID=A0ABT5YBC7_9GAMM|nr:CoA ester lyase [Marinobacter iranensis]MDF0750851.1 CoA ester lyase [Marinobacter iranensis]
MTYRSYLFVPADSPKKMSKAGGGEAEALILDLEDAVADDAKAEARGMLTEFLAEPIAPARFVRVNAMDTGLTEADVAATAALHPDGYVLPKCKGPGDVEALARLIDKHNGPRETQIMAIATETVRAVRCLMREDWSHPRLSAITWGGEDLVADMGAYSNRSADGDYASPFVLVRDLTLFAALEAAVAPVDAVFTNFKDNEGLARETAAASAMGFTGKMAIHPAQVPVINAAFTPHQTQIDWANRVLEAFARAGTGIARLEGEMLDLPHRKRAEAILATVRRIETAKDSW